VGGLGGCPNAPGATGNVATETVVETLRDAGEEVPVDVEGLHRALKLLDPFLKEERCTLPRDGSPACAECDYAEGEICCGKTRSPA